MFGDVIDGEMCLNKFGHIVKRCWAGLANHYDYVELDTFVTMPNHIHGVITLADSTAERSTGAGLNPALAPLAPLTPFRRHALPEIVRGFKTFSSRRINEARSAPGQLVWQRNYYEHVIRDEQELGAVRNYITGNPARWAQDIDNPANLK
jgi:REP element-mobilizing transposase RayT